MSVQNKWFAGAFYIYLSSLFPISIRVGKQIHTQGHIICICSSLLICSKNKTCYHLSLRNSYAEKRSMGHSRETVDCYSDHTPSVTHNKGQDTFSSRKVLLRPTLLRNTFNLEGILDNSTKIVFYSQSCFQSVISPGK